MNAYSFLCQPPLLYPGFLLLKTVFLATIVFWGSDSGSVKLLEAMLTVTDTKNKVDLN